MASETKRTPVVLSNEWQDLCNPSIFDDIANQDIFIQLQSSLSARVIFGGSEAPDGADASLELLQWGQAVRGNADHIWVKGTGILVVHVEG